MQSLYDLVSFIIPVSSLSKETGFGSTEERAIDSLLSCLFIKYGIRTRLRREFGQNYISDTRDGTRYYVRLEKSIQDKQIAFQCFIDKST